MTETMYDDTVLLGYYNNLTYYLVTVLTQRAYNFNFT